MCTHLEFAFLQVYLKKKKEQIQPGEDRRDKEKEEAAACPFAWSAALLRVPII